MSWREELKKTYQSKKMYLEGINPLETQILKVKEPVMKATKNNRLTHKQYHEANMLLVSLKEKIEKGEYCRMLMSEFAEMISKTLGFHLTMANLRTCLEAISVRWPRSTRSGGWGSGSSANSIRGNRGRITAKYLCQLFEELGKEVPEDLRRCASSVALPRDDKSEQ